MKVGVQSNDKVSICAASMDIFKKKVTTNMLNMRGQER